MCKMVGDSPYGHCKRSGNVFTCMHVQSAMDASSPPSDGDVFADYNIVDYNDPEPLVAVLRRGVQRSR